MENPTSHFWFRPFCCLLFIYLFSAAASISLSQVPNSNSITKDLAESQKERLDKLLDETNRFVKNLNPRSTQEVFDKALNTAFEALELSQDQKDKASISLSLFLIARIFEEKADSEKAADYYKRSLENIVEAKGEETNKIVLQGIEKAQRITLKNLGRMYLRLGRYEDALKWLDTALPLFREDEKDDKLGTIFRYRGDSLEALGRFDEAEFSYAKSLEIFNFLGLDLDKGIVLSNLGKHYQGKDNNAKALKSYIEAESFLKDSPPNSDYQDSRIWNLHRISSIYLHLSDPAGAQPYIDIAKKLQASIISPENLLLHYFIEGRDLKNKGKPEEALEAYKQGMEMAAKYEALKYTQTEFLLEMAFVYFRLKKGDEGLKCMFQAVEIAKDVKDKSHMSYVFERAADAAYVNNGLENAVEFWRAAVLSLQKDEELKLRMKYMEALARLLNKLAKAQIEMGDTSSALVNYHTSLTIQLTLPNKIELVRNLQNLTKGFSILKKKRLAIFFGKLAVSGAQEVRMSLKTLPIESQRAFLKANGETFKTLIGLLLDENRTAEAHEIFNLFQDQNFYDSMDYALTEKKPITFTEREKSMAGKIDMSAIKLSTFSQEFREVDVKRDFRKLTEEETKRLEEIRARILQTGDELDTTLGEIEKVFTNPPDEKDKLKNVPSTENAQAMLRNLRSMTGQQAVIIYTLETSENYEGLIITQDKIAKFSYPEKIAELRSKQIQYVRQLSEVDGNTGIPKASEENVKKAGLELYKIIFVPIEEKLSELKAKPDVLMWSLDDTLRYLPVGALFDGKRWLVERYGNTVFTRADPGRMLASVSERWTGVGFYTSEDHVFQVNGKLQALLGLKNAKTEVETIFGVPPKPGIIAGEFLANDQFTKETFLGALKTKRPLVHIASHFQFEAGDSDSSFLLLGDGDGLTLKDIKDKPESIFSGVELLTLSACETGLQKERESDGREIDNFAELAQRKGAQAVLASLWKVADESTSRLMTMFYQLKQKRLTKADSLRKSQLNLLKDGRYSHPYYWSPFILIGNWK